MKVAAAALAVCIIAFAVGLMLFAGVTAHDACSGQVFDTVLCENSRLRQSILASALVGSSVIAASVVAGALIVVARGESSAAPAAGDDSE